MKKALLISCVILAAFLCTAATLTTTMSSYKTLDSIANINTPDTDPRTTPASSYFVGIPSGSIDLRSVAGAGYDTYANTIALTLHVVSGANGDTVTQVITGAVDQGPQQIIAQVVWKIGLAQVDATATNLWAETATVTSAHASTITVTGADGDNDVGQVLIPANGYRYIKSYFTADTGDPTTVTCLYRYF